MTLFVALVVVGLTNQNQIASKADFIWQKDVSMGQKGNVQFAGKEELLVWSNNDGFVLADNQTGEIKHFLKTPGPKGRVWISEDNTLARFGSTNGFTEVNLESEKSSVFREFPGPASFSKDGKFIAVASPDLKVTILDETRKVVAIFDNCKSPFFVNDGSRIVAFDAKSGEEIVANVADRAIETRMKVNAPSYVWNDGGRTLVTNDSDIYEITNEGFLRVFENPDKGSRPVDGVAGSVLLSTQAGSKILRTKDWQTVMSNKTLITDGACLSRDGAEIIYGGNFVTGYSVSTNKQTNIYALAGSQGLCRVSSDNAYVLTQFPSPFGYTAITDLRSKKTIGFIPSSPYSACFVGTQSFAIMGKEGLQIIKLPSLSVENTFNIPFGYLASPQDGSLLALACLKGGLIVLDPKNGRAVNRQNLGNATSVTFSPSGALLAIIDGTTVRIQSGRTFEDLIKVKVTSLPVHSSNFSFDRSEKYLLAVINSPVNSGGQFSLIDISIGVNMGPALPPTPFHSSNDGSLIATFPPGKGLIILETPSLNQVAWVGNEIGSVSDCIPLGRNSGAFTLTNKRIGMLSMPKDAKK